MAALYIQFSDNKYKGNCIGNTSVDLYQLYYKTYCNEHVAKVFKEQNAEIHLVSFCCY